MHLIEEKMDIEYLAGVEGELAELGPGVCASQQVPSRFLPHLLYVPPHLDAVAGTSRAAAFRCPLACHRHRISLSCKCFVAEEGEHRLMAGLLEVPPHRSGRGRGRENNLIFARLVVELR